MIATRLLKKTRRQKQQCLAVDVNALCLQNDYGYPEFAYRGYYVDRVFYCIDCGIKQVWTQAQQKWWFEVIKGNVCSVARRCRACRIKERERKEEARRVSIMGMNAKRRAAGKELNETGEG